MKNVLVPSVIAGTAALAAVLYFINSKETESSISEISGSQSGASQIGSSSNEPSARTNTVESSAVSGVAPSVTKPPVKIVGEDGVERYVPAESQSGQPVTEDSLPPAAQEAVRQRRAGSQNSGVDNDRMDAAAGAQKAYEEAEGKKEK